MSKQPTRREEIEETLELIGSDRAIHLCDASVVVAELKALWAREAKLEAVVGAARNVMELSKGGPILLADALEDLDEHDARVNPDPGVNTEAMNE